MNETSEHRCRRGNTPRQALFPFLFPRLATVEGL